MLVGIKEFRMGRNNIPEVVGNTFVDPTSIYLMRETKLEKYGIFYRLSLNQGAQLMIDEEGFMRIMQSVNGDGVKVLA